MQTDSSLKVLYLSAEAEPYIRVGGLGDVAGALPPALRALEPEDEDQPRLDVRLAIPFHGLINRSGTEFHRLSSFNLPHTNGSLAAEVYVSARTPTPTYLIGGDPIQPNAPVYSADWGFDAYKYIFFSLAALEGMRRLNWQPDIVHANDWATAAAVYWLALHRANDPFYRYVATALTIHNLAYIGNNADLSMFGFGLPPAKDARLPAWARQLPLPLGLLTADQIITISPSYAREIQMTEFGAGLDDLLRARQDNLCGVLNGIDTARWDPASDPYLSINYSAHSLSLRDANKIALLSQLGFLTGRLEERWQNAPLIAMIGELDYPQGFDLALQALQSLLEKSRRKAGAMPEWRAVLVGSGRPELEADARRLEEHYPDRIRLALRQDSLLCHQLYGAADIFLAPARTDPGGQNHLLAMRYGCLPVAQATGVLRDTINNDPDERTGFLYEGMGSLALAKTLESAFGLFQQRPHWLAAQQRAMQQDFSWQHSARAYRQLYLELARRRRQPEPTLKPQPSVLNGGS